MTRHLPLTFALVAVLAGISSSQGKVSAVPVFNMSAHSAVLPIDVDNNILRIKVRINGSRPLTMIFDTGASGTIIDEALVKELGLKTTSDRLNGHGTGGDFTGHYIKTSTISVDGVEVPDQPLAAIKLNKPPDFDFDGVLGYDFIAPFIVEIDYAAKVLKLWEPKTYVCRGAGEIIPLDIRGRKTPRIKATFTDPHHVSYLAMIEVDSGYDGVFQLNSPFVRTHRMKQQFTKGKSDESHGAGGDEAELSVRFASVRFGRAKISQPPVDLSLATKGSGAGTDADGLVGGEVLRRFHVILDYSRRRMILEKTAAFTEPYSDEREK